MELTVSGEDLIALTLIIAIGFLLAVAFYESLATRDVLVKRVQAIARAVSSRRWVHASAYLLTVVVGIPLLIVIWTVLLETALFLVASVELLDDLAVISVAIVGAARILAYVREKTAHELAQAVPLALLFLLLTGGPLDLDVKADALAQRDALDITTGMLAFLVVLELSLRFATDASHALLASIRRRRGIESDLGVWRTMWQVLRGAPTSPD